MKKVPRKHKGTWFVKVRGSYLPCTWQGWLTYVPYVVFLVAAFLMVDKTSHSASDTLIGIVPYWVSAAVVMTWLARTKS